MLRLHLHRRRKDLLSTLITRGRTSGVARLVGQELVEEDSKKTGRPQYEVNELISFL